MSRFSKPLAHLLAIATALAGAALAAAGCEAEVAVVGGDGGTGGTGGGGTPPACEAFEPIELGPARARALVRAGDSFGVLSQLGTFMRISNDGVPDAAIAVGDEYGLAAGDESFMLAARDRLLPVAADGRVGSEVMLPAMNDLPGVIDLAANGAEFAVLFFDAMSPMGEDQFPTGPEYFIHTDGAGAPLDPPLDLVPGAFVPAFHALGARSDGWRIARYDSIPDTLGWSDLDMHGNVMSTHELQVSADDFVEYYQLEGPLLGAFSSRYDPGSYAVQFADLSATPITLELLADHDSARGPRMAVAGDRYFVTYASENIAYLAIYRSDGTVIRNAPIDVIPSNGAWDAPFVSVTSEGDPALVWSETGGLETHHFAILNCD